MWPSIKCGSHFLWDGETLYIAIVFYFHFLILSRFYSSGSATRLFCSCVIRLFIRATNAFAIFHDLWTPSHRQVNENDNNNSNAIISVARPVSFGSVMMKKHLIFFFSSSTLSPEFVGITIHINKVPFIVAATQSVRLCVCLWQHKTEILTKRNVNRKLCSVLTWIRSLPSSFLSRYRQYLIFATIRSLLK